MEVKSEVNDLLNDTKLSHHLPLPEDVSLTPTKVDKGHCDGNFIKFQFTNYFSKKALK